MRNRAIYGLLCVHGLGFGMGLTGCSTPSDGSRTQPYTGTSVYVLQEDAGIAAATTGSVLQFEATAAGTATPINAISAASGTTFSGLATDGSGNVYVATPTAIEEFTTGSIGTATPTRSLPLNTTTMIGNVDGIAADNAGDIFIGEDSGGVAAFSATANGSVAPSRYILGASQLGGGLSTLVKANQVAADSSDNLYVLNQGGTTLATIDVFAPSATGNVAPLRTIAGSQTTLGSPQSLTVDSSGNLWVTNNTCVVSLSSVTCNGSILEFAAGASGNVAPIRTIAGAATELQFLSGIKVDSSGNVYVVSQLLTSPLTGLRALPTVIRFSGSASGNAAPASSFYSTVWSTPDSGGSIAVH